MDLCVVLPSHNEATMICTLKYTFMLKHNTPHFELVSPSITHLPLYLNPSAALLQHLFLCYLLDAYTKGLPCIIWMNVDFVWYSLKHPRINNPTLHLLHLVRMPLLFPCAEQKRLFILLAEEAGQWCHLASCRWCSWQSRVSTYRGHCGWGRPPAARYSMPRTRARRKPRCDNFAPQDNRMKMFRIVRHSKWK